MILSLIFLITSLHATRSAREPPKVTLVNQGEIQGTFKTLLRTQRIVAFNGIPYAQPPIDGRRFAPPDTSELPRWKGVRNGSIISPDCMQNFNQELSRHDELFINLLRSQRDPNETKEYDEDCLYLNVFTPEGFQKTDKLPVLFWIHPGDFVRGSPHDLNPFQIVYKQKVVFVSVAYRLSVLGFFSSLDGLAPGNFGLMDQVAALEWVQNNIESFGGDKDNVCLFGQGSGAISVGLHLTSEWSIGLFHKVIAMSGNVLAPDTVKIPKREGSTLNKLSVTFGCFPTPTSALLSCLRNVPVQPLLNEAGQITDWKPIIDDKFSNASRPFIVDQPNVMFDRGMYQRVPILTGFTNMEDALLLSREDAEDSGISKKEFDMMRDDIIFLDIPTSDNNSCTDNQKIIFEAVAFFYNVVPPTTNETILRKQFLDFYSDKVHGATTYRMARIMNAEVPVYLYRFDLKPISKAPNEDIPSWVGVAHNFDLVYVFGLPYMALPEDYSKWQSSDKRVSDIILKMWSNFARFSNPTNSGLYINWEQFNSESPGFLIIDKSFNMSTPENVNYKALEFWNDFYPKVVEIGTKCCNITESGVDHVYSSFSILSLCTVIFLWCLCG